MSYNYYNSQGIHIVGNNKDGLGSLPIQQPQQQQQNVNRFLHLFQQLDTDYDGYLSVDETRGLMWASFGSEPPRGVVEAFNELLRVHQGNKLDYTTVLNFYNKARNPTPVFTRPPQPTQIPQPIKTPTPKPVSIGPIITSIPIPDKIPSSINAPKPRNPINTESKPVASSSSSSSSTIGTHFISKEEQRAFVEYINAHEKISQDNDLVSTGLIPINPDSKLYENVTNGVLLCKLLNAVKPGTVPKAQIKKNPKTVFESTENQNLVILGAKKLGCSVVNIGPQDLIEGKPHLVLGLIWQVIKLDLLSKVSVKEHPELCQLVAGGSNTLDPMSLQQMSEIPPEQVLLRWMNHHLKNAGYQKTVKNFSSDVQDGSVYTVLMNQISNGMCPLDPLYETDLSKRLEMVWKNAQGLGCAKFVTPADILSGNSKLNLAFAANLFNSHPGISLPSMEDLERLRQQNAQMASILSDAEARLRQLMADRKLAEELQNMEIQAAKEREMERQRQLALSEALAREEQSKENMTYQEKRRQKDEEIQKTSVFMHRENYTESQQRDYERKLFQEQQNYFLQQQRGNRSNPQQTMATAASAQSASYLSSSSSYGSSYGSDPSLSTRRDITQQSSFMYGPPVTSDEFLEGPYYESGDRKNVFERVGRRVDKKVAQVKDTYRYG